MLPKFWKIDPNPNPNPKIWDWDWDPSADPWLRLVRIFSLKACDFIKNEKIIYKMWLFWRWRYKNDFQMVEKADKTIEVMTGEIKQYQDERGRSKSG